MFHEAIRRALLQEWGPIGVGAIAEAQDEYESYVLSSYEMLILQKSRHEILDYLWWLKTGHMGLTGDRRGTEKFAERFIRISEEVDKAMAQAPMPPLPSVGPDRH